MRDIGRSISLKSFNSHELNLVMYHGIHRLQKQSFEKRTGMVKHLAVHESHYPGCIVLNQM